MELASLVELPPGFRFHPTDQEIIINYLLNKVLDTGFVALAIGEADLNKSEPWDLPQKAKMGEKEWFFFWQTYRKYTTGMRTNRATESGYWKATGKDRMIYHKGCLVGMKRTLVFYIGRSPKGERTDWVMHEYRLEGNFSNYNLSRIAKEEWVVCRVFHKNHTPESTLPPLMDYSCCDERPSSTFADELIEPNISSSRLIFNNHELQNLQHEKTNFPFQDDDQVNSSTLANNIGMEEHQRGSKFETFSTNNSVEVTIESQKSFDEQVGSLYFDSLWSY